MCREEAVFRATRVHFGCHVGAGASGALPSFRSSSWTPIGIWAAGTRRRNESEPRWLSFFGRSLRPLFSKSSGFQEPTYITFQFLKGGRNVGSAAHRAGTEAPRRPILLRGHTGASLPRLRTLLVLVLPGTRLPMLIVNQAVFASCWLSQRFERTWSAPS
jgi:hypothetical protein